MGFCFFFLEPCLEVVLEPSDSNSDLKDETSFINEVRSVATVRELEGEDGDLRFLGGITRAS